MDPDYYITKAIHALNTEQPNLAMLYMRRGYREMKVRRPDPYFDLRDGMNALIEAFQPLVQVFQEVAEVFMKFGQDVQRVYDQDFFTLVADNEG